MASFRLDLAPKDLQAPPGPGIYRLESTIDATRNVVESNENNNTRTMTVTIVR